jgi:hypothetical protein
VRGADTDSDSGNQRIAAARVNSPRAAAAKNRIEKPSIIKCP